MIAALGNYLIVDIRVGDPECADGRTGMVAGWCERCGRHVLLRS